MATRKVTRAQAEIALAEVARQLGGVPTGPEAARHGDGPELNMAWDWSGEPTPTILLESSLFSDWAIEIDGQAISRATGGKVFAEPSAGYALSLYPAEPDECSDCGDPNPGHECPVAAGEAAIERTNAAALEAGLDDELERDAARFDSIEGVYPPAARQAAREASAEPAEVAEIVEWLAKEATAIGNEVTPEVREAFVRSARAIVANGNGKLMELIRRDHEAARRGYHRLTIEQLDERGNVYRTFNLHPAPADLDRALDDARRAYNMAATRLIVDGQVVEEPAPRVRWSPCPAGGCMYTNNCPIHGWSDPVDEAGEPV